MADLVATAHQTIVRKRGDSFPLAITVLKPDRSAKDLSAAISVRYGWAKGWEGGPRQFTLTLGAGVEIMTPDDSTVPNLVLVRVPDEVLAGLAAGDYVDELEIVDAGGNRATAWFGPVRLEPDVLS